MSALATQLLPGFLHLRYRPPTTRTHAIPRIQIHPDVSRCTAWKPGLRREPLANQSLAARKMSPYQGFKVGAEDPDPASRIALHRFEAGPSSSTPREAADGRDEHEQQQTY